MDALKNRMGNETEDDKKKRKKSLLCPNILLLAICIAMVVIGYQYSDPKDCRVAKAPLFLLLGGGIIIATSLLKIIAYLTSCEWDDKFVDIVTPIAGVANFAVLIWGSITVFGAYAEWDYENPDSPTYCAYTPFMFVFVMLVIFWVMFPFLCCCELMAFCCSIFYKSVGTTDANNSANSTNNA